MRTPEVHEQGIDHHGHGKQADRVVHKGDFDAVCAELHQARATIERQADELARLHLQARDAGRLRTS